MWERRIGGVEGMETSFGIHCMREKSNKNKNNQDNPTDMLMGLLVSFCQLDINPNIMKRRNFS